MFVGRWEAGISITQKHKSEHPRINFAVVRGPSAGSEYSIVVIIEIACMDNSVGETNHQESNAIRIREEEGI